MEGFVLICEKCGKEIKLKGNEFYHKQLHDKLGVTLGIDWYYQSVEIECDCGNYVQDS